MFFVDLEPAAINTDIFNVTSILHTKIKIEEPHKRRDILQCHNCQDYGHSKKYCSYSPRCVRCGDEPPPIAPKPGICRPSVPFARVTIPRITKVVKHTKVSNSSVISPQKKNSNYTNNVNYVNNSNIEATHQHTSITNTPSDSPKSYAQAASPNNSSQTSNSLTNDNTLLNFLNEFKSLINPLLSLLTTVLDRLIKQNAN